MNLTLISQYFYPEMISTGHILSELLVELTNKGIKAFVICAQPTYYSTKKVKSKLNFKGIEIIRTHNSQYNKNSKKGKILNSLSYFLLALGLALRQKKNGLVLLVTNPPFLGIIGLILYITKKRPFIVIIHDLYPDIAIKMGYIGKRSPITAFWNLLNRWIFYKASFIIVLGRDVQQVIKSRVKLKHRHKVIYIPNWADPSLIYPIEFSNNSFIKELGLENKFIVQYSGNMGLIHDMETIIKAARELKREETIEFLLIGGGGKLKLIKEMVRSYRLRNVTFLPYQERENLKNSLCAGHVSLISLEKDIQGLSVPSKLYGIMASGRPAIAIMAENCEVAITLREFRCGLVIPPKDVFALVDAITWFMVNESERIAMGRRAYKAFLENFTVQHCADQYYQLFKQL